MAFDLHMHSTASDGTDAPERLAELALAHGLRGIALTDHDTTAGLSRCAAACEAAGVIFVPGIEISADPGRPRGTMHILGYFVAHDAPVMHELAAEMLAARMKRIPAMVARLAELGVHLSMDDVHRHAADAATIGRPHIAAAMLERGYVGSIDEAFKRYLGYGGAAFLRRDHLPVERAIDAIHSAGGVAVLAHAVQLKYTEEAELRRVIEKLTTAGLDGLEVHHSDHTAADRAMLQKIADDLRLVPTGGSDYHGSRKTVRMGSQQVADEVIQRLHQRRRPSP